jgi:hypothetical protein
MPRGLLHGGSQGLKASLTRTVNTLGRKLKLLKDDLPNLSGDHVREGLGAIISVKVGSQTTHLLLARPLPDAEPSLSCHGGHSGPLAHLAPLTPHS